MVASSATTAIWTDSRRWRTASRASASRDPRLAREQPHQLRGEQPLTLLLDEIVLVAELVLRVALVGRAIEAPVLAAEDPGRAHDALDLLLRDLEAQRLGLEREQRAVDQGLDGELVERVPHRAGVVAFAEALLDLLLAALADALEHVAAILVGSDPDDGAVALPAQRPPEADEEDEHAADREHEEPGEPTLAAAQGIEHVCSSSTGDRTMRWGEGARRAYGRVFRPASRRLGSAAA